MKSFTLIKSLSGPVTCRTARRQSRRVRKLRLEVLEERIVLSASQNSAAAYGNLPLAFEVNEGQTASHVDFLARGDGYMVSLTPSAAVLTLNNGSDRDVLSLRLVGANPQTHVVEWNELITKSNYLIGSDPSQWHTNIANYGKIEYQSVYAGINLVYYGTNQGQLEYDFVVAPGVDPGVIKLSIEGAQSIMLDAEGNLVLNTSGGDLVQHAPVIYQELDGQRQSVTGAFVLDGNNQFSFQIGTYDARLPLTIDPVLSYSTYLGGSGDDVAWDIAVDADGSAYITGRTDSTNFPTANPMQPVMAGDPVTTYDAFVAKLNATGTALIYSTYLGGTLDEEGYGVAVDASGNAYVTGYTSSGDFATTANAFQGSANPYNSPMAFMAKLNPAGSGLLYSSLLGSITGNTGGNSIAVDGAGNAYVTGQTADTDFITTPGAFQETSFTPNHAFVTKFDPSQTGPASLVYSTYLGGTNGWDYGNGIAVDSAGNAYVTGLTESTDFPTTAGALQTAFGGGADDAFVTKLNAAGSALLYSTFLGGSLFDYGAGIAVDAAGSAFVTGSTNSTNFPTTASALQPSKFSVLGDRDAFVVKLDVSGSALAYSTYVGGSGQDYGRSIAVDAYANAYVTGYTDSANFPTTANALQPAKGGGDDAFVAKLNGSGTALAHSTYLGGSGNDSGYGIAVDSTGSAYVTGATRSTNFPTTPGALQQANGGGYADAFVARVDLSGVTLSIGNVALTEGNTGTRTASFTVTLSGSSAQTVTVSYATANGSATAGSDYIATSGTLTFDPGVTSLTISVTVNGDTVIEPDEVFYVNLSNASPGAELSDGQGVGTIRDDDTPPTKFYVVNDGSPDRTYEYDATGTALENYSLTTGNTAPRGVASNADGTRIWVVDANKNVYVYNNSGGLLGSWTAGSLPSNATVEGIATNGTDVWIVDARGDKVYRYAGAATRLSGSQNATSNFRLNSSNTSPKDIVTDGVSFWVVNDSTTDKVFKYTVAGSLLGSWTISSANSKPTGLTIDPANVSDIWIVDSGTDTVYQYTAAASRISGSQSAAVTFALAAGNTNPQGIADPPPMSFGGRGEGTGAQSASQSNEPSGSGTLHVAAVTGHEQLARPTVSTVTNLSKPLQVASLAAFQRSFLTEQTPDRTILGSRVRVSELSARRVSANPRLSTATLRRISRESALSQFSSTGDSSTAMEVLTLIDELFADAATTGLESAI